ncbi:MAG: DNA polymerase III subunit delta [Rhodanobacter sp.]
MPTTAAQWPKTLAADALAPVYLLAGVPLLVIEAADGLRARARELGYDEREVLDVGQHFDWDDLARAAAGMSLFATRRLLDLRLPAGRPGVEGAKAITAFCADPPADVTLLVTALEWSRKHDGAWSRKLDAVGVMVVFNPPQGGDWPAWIGARLASRGLSATREAIALLAERAEGNLLAAAQEIDKLAMLHGAGRLDVSEMEALVADSARFDVFKLTDAALAGEAARALRILAVLRAEGDELLALMGWLVNQLQLALRLAIAPDLDSQMRAEHVFAARENLFRQALRRAPSEHWLRCLRRAGRIDRMVKGRELGDPWREAERLVAVIANPRMARALT